jgi:hypothetical protein
MVEPGQILLADIGAPTRVAVAVLSSTRFHQATARAMVAPEHRSPQGDEEVSPWHVESNGRTFAVDRMRSISVERLLETIGRASHREHMHMQRAAKAVY